jgi:anti-sigma factor RsiW
MDINRNNYEGFFLQYVDGELDLAGKKAVEAFVRLNPDLQAELLMLQETVLQAEPFIFDNKAVLYKTSEDTQAQLLQYLDKELSPAETKLLEQQLITDKALQHEWNILQQTQLDAQEVMVFADKASLYRQSPARVVGAKWWRMAIGLWGMGRYCFDKWQQQRHNG